MGDSIDSGLTADVPKLEAGEPNVADGNRTEEKEIEKDTESNIDVGRESPSGDAAERSEESSTHFTGAPDQREEVEEQQSRVEAQAISEKGEEVSSDPSSPPNKKDEGDAEKPESDAFDFDDSDDEVIVKRKIIRKSSVKKKRSSSAAPSEKSANDVSVTKEKQSDEPVDGTKDASVDNAKAASDIDDNEFIASDDDNDSLAEEYRKQKEYESDDDPFGDDMDKQDGASGLGISSGTGDDGPESFSGIIEAYSKRKSATRKKQATDGAVDIRVDDILKRMKEAILRDNKARANRKPATYKLAMLNEVCTALLHSDLQCTMLDRGALYLLAQWLRPSKIDASLPALQIRTKIISLLPQLRLELEHLEKSEFGKIAAYLSVSEKETKENRKKLRAQIEKWAKLIFVKKQRSKSTYHEDAKDEEDNLDSSKRRSSRAKDSETPRKKMRDSKMVSSVKKDSLSNLVIDRGHGARDSRGRSSRTGNSDENETSTRKAHRAQIPQPLSFDYSRMPEDNLRKQGAGVTDFGNGDDIDGTKLQTTSATSAQVTKRKELEKKLKSFRKQKKAS